MAPPQAGRGVATADILTRGRTVFGVGRGYHTREVETFGAPMLDAEANRDLFEEQVEILMMAFHVFRLGRIKRPRGPMDPARAPRAPALHAPRMRWALSRQAAAMAAASSRVRRRSSIRISPSTTVVATSAARPA